MHVSKFGYPRHLFFSWLKNSLLGCRCLIPVSDCDAAADEDQEIVRKAAIAFTAHWLFSFVATYASTKGGGAQKIPIFVFQKEVQIIASAN